MLDRRRRRRANINPTLGERLVLAGMWIVLAILCDGCPCVHEACPVTDHQ